MKRILPLVVIVVVSAGSAYATVELSVDRVGNFEAQNGGTLVEVYRLTFFSDSDLISGFSFSLTGGYQIGAPASPPFQPNPFLTPTVTEAASLPAVLRAADTHFLLRSAAFVPAITSPTETNDFGFGAQPSWSEGIGGLTVQSGLALSAQARCVTLVNIAAVDVEDVAFYGTVGEKGGAAYSLMLPFFWWTSDDAIGGPYSIAPGQMLTLDGSGGTDLSFWRWDLDDDLDFDDASGQFVDVSYDYLIDTLGLSMGRYVIGLERETSGGALSRAWTQLDIVPEPATLSLLALGGLAVLRRRSSY